LTVIVDY